MNGETLATSGITGAPSLTTAATPASAVGLYAIVAAPGTLAAANYTFTVVSGTLIVTDQAPVAADDGYATDENVPLTVPVPGVLANDTDADLGDTLTAVLTIAGTPAIKLSWTAAPGATSYHVKRASTSGGPYATIATQVVSPG